MSKGIEEMLMLWNILRKEEHVIPNPTDVKHMYRIDPRAVGADDPWCC